MFRKSYSYIQDCLQPSRSYLKITINKKYRVKWCAVPRIAVRSFSWPRVRRDHCYLSLRILKCAAFCSYTKFFIGVCLWVQLLEVYLSVFIKLVLRFYTIVHLSFFALLLGTSLHLILEFIYWWHRGDTLITSSLAKHESGRHSIVVSVHCEGGLEHWTLRCGGSPGKVD